MKIARLTVLSIGTLAWAMVAWATPTATHLQGVVTRVGDGDSLSFAPTG